MFLSILIFVLNVVGQSMQNIFLPLALSGGEDMSVVLVYTAFVYFCFFSIVDVLLDTFISIKRVPVAEAQIASVGFQNALNGIGAIFGGSSTRTPLTMQMSGSLVINLLAPFYKMLVFRISPFKFASWLWYGAAVVLYVAAFVLTLVDKLQNTDSGALSPFCILFWMGVLFGMTYNVHQEKMMVHVHYQEMTLLQSLKTSTHILRKQITFLFLFTWLSVALALIPSFDQRPLTSDGFFSAWADFLPFGNTYMNLFNLGYILSFVTSVFMNKYDSSFNMLVSNISAVLSLWTGWLPSIRDQTVGFYPSVALTATAMILSIIAIYPSYKYSLHMRQLVRERLHDEQKQQPLLYTDSPTNGHRPSNGSIGNGYSSIDHYTALTVPYAAE